MKTFLLVLLLVAAIGVVLPLAFFYWRFQQSPARMWKTRLIRLRDELFARRRVLMTGSAESASELRKLADEFFKKYLAGIPTSALAEFPGIGPGTVEKLRQVGLKSVADLPGFVFESIPGIGPAKGAELRSALTALVNQCRSKFDAGACKEGQDYRAAAAARSAERQQREQASLREAQAIDVTLAELDPLLARAAGVTFPSFLLRKPTDIPAELLAAPLPVVRIPDAPLPPPPPVPTPPPVLAASPVLARKDSAPVVLPPRATDRKAPEPKDLFEDMLGQTVAKPVATSAAEVPGLAAMKALAGFGFLVAKADGRIAQAERKAVREYLERRFGGDPVLVRFIDVTMEQAEKAIPTEVDAMAGVLAAVAEGERADVLAWAERIADASGERHAREAELLGRLRDAFGIHSVVIESGVLTSRDNLDAVPNVRTCATRPAAIDARVLLDIAPEVELSVDLIRRRWALLSEKLDPVRAAAMGAEFAQMAEEKRAKLKAAAEELLKPFGEPLEKPAAPVSTDLRPNQDLDEAFGM